MNQYNDAKYCCFLVIQMEPRIKKKKKKVCMIVLLAFKIERFFLRTATKKDERETIKEVEANIVIWFELQKI